MIEFPLKTPEDIEAYDRSVRVTRAALGLPPAFEEKVILQAPPPPGYGNNRMSHYWADGIQLRVHRLHEDHVRRCNTVVPRGFLDGTALKFLNFPCPCGRVVWRVETWAETRNALDRGDQANIINTALERLMAKHGFV